MGSFNRQVSMKKFSILSAVILAGALSSCAAPRQQASDAPFGTPAQMEERVRQAEAGDIKAQEELCGTAPASNSLYKPGDEGLRMCEMAAAQGSIYAMLDLSSRYEMAIGVETDHAKSYEWLKRATETKPQAGDVYQAEAYGSMADVHELGLHGRKPDQRAAFNWHLKAAKLGWSNSYPRLAYMYEAGIGTRQDFGAAAKWYRMAAENGGCTSAHNLATLYLKGLGVPRDLNKAYFWDAVGTRLEKKNAACVPPVAPFPYNSYASDAQLKTVDAEVSTWEAGKTVPK